MAATAKTLVPNTAQTIALQEGVASGFLPAGTPNQVRTAQACVRRGWATEAGDRRFAITAAGCQAVGAVVRAELVAAGEPVVEPAAVVVDEPAAVEVEPAAEVVEAAPVGGKPGLLTGAVAGLRVHHLEPVPTCAGTGHRNGVMTGQARVTKGRDHVQVTLDCGHVRWPLLRVMIAGTQPGHTPPATA